MSFRSRTLGSGIFYIPGFRRASNGSSSVTSRFSFSAFSPDCSTWIDPLGILALVPIEVVKNLFVWQLATYLFLHGGFGHILWNMLALWMFGADIESVWGTRRFLQFYFFCGDRRRDLCRAS